MKKNFQIAVPKPCHEKWDSFTKTSNGGFCNSCRKEVIDFTSWNDERMKSYFKNPPSNTCGRFRPQQLKVYAKYNARPTPPPLVSVFFAGALMLFSSRQVTAQQASSIHPTEQFDAEKKTVGEVSLSARSSTVEVRGVVKSRDDGTVMPGVNVLLKGTNIGISTDVNGNFVITVEDASSLPVLVFSFIGFRSIENAVDVTKAQQLLEVNMIPEVMQLGGLVLGGVNAYRWYSPKRWWWKVRSVFRRG